MKWRFIFVLQIYQFLHLLKFTFLTFYPILLQVLEESGVRHLNTLCHGDAKPNNFMFRKIDIDFEDEDDEELKDLKCEGVESMLIDWQGGFLGKV